MKIRQKIFENSTSISFAEWDPITHTMKVCFKKTGIYEFYGVEEATYEEFSQAPSAGKYFHANIKGKYGTYYDSNQTKVE